ncbi:MAG: 1,2-phenylacetyl-CoA epoxidase subunit PaaE [Candidatus Dormibacteria bacterium]
MTVSPVAEASAGHRRATIHPLRVKAVEPLTDDSVVIEFDVPPELAAEFSFTHGQHVSLRCEAAGDGTRRSYSICGAAGSGRLRVAVKRLPGGIFSAFALERLRAGDVVEVVTPIGHFNTPLDQSRATSYAMIAAGSGIAPILSNLSTILAVEPHSMATLIYANRTVKDIMFLEELEDLKNRYPERFALYHVLSREEQEVQLFHGHIDAERLNMFLDQLVRPEDVDEWFLCGPREMIDSARTVLLERGVEADHVHAELFHAKDAQRPRAAEHHIAAGAAGAAEVTIILDGRSSTFPVDPDGERILDAALRVRSDAPYACKGGVCGTCRAKLISGSVEMDQHFALEQRDMDAGFVLACQSHPTTPKVVIDFDQ